MIDPYDIRMSRRRADEIAELLPGQVDGLEWPDSTARIFFAGGVEYRRVMRCAVELLQARGIVQQNVTLEATSGGLGFQRSQLRQYLQSLSRCPGVADVAGAHENGTPLFRKGWGHEVGSEVMVRYPSRMQSEAGVIHELFIGPAGPTATVSFSALQQRRRRPHSRWISIENLMA